ncbi:uncharacterized protein LOC135217519 [Macrobrachium nipponense]|uniref:uncharacterized protein LOC135217519 n=1 Tax=Macrobrachium nipponense TaxID=159736 RepID=UPI0030C8126E
MSNFALVLAAASGVLLAVSLCEGCPFPFDTIGSQCLLFDTLEFGSYYDMRLYCTRVAEGARLAKVPTANQLAEIIKYINKYGLDRYNYWIDASDEDLEGYWRWGDGTSVPMGAPYWRYDCDEALTMRPLTDKQQNCAILDKESNYLFADTSCLGDVGEIKYCPVCEIA